LLLLAHLAEAAPWPIPMMPWWVVTFLWCQLHGQLIGTGLHVRMSLFLAVVTRVEFWWCCPCFVVAIFWWNIQLEVPPRVEFTPHPQAGNTTGCGPHGVVFPYFLARKYHPGGILAITHRCIITTTSFSHLIMIMMLHHHHDAIKLIMIMMLQYSNSLNLALCHEPHHDDMTPLQAN
jgi:hypothetical protein